MNICARHIVLGGDAFCVTWNIMEIYTYIYTIFLWTFRIDFWTGTKLQYVGSDPKFNMISPVINNFEVKSEETYLQPY